MEFSEVIKKRRSIRRFKEEIPDINLIKKCIEAACYAPSAQNSQPWKFIVVKNRETIEKLSETQPYTKFLKEAPTIIVVLGDKEKSPNHWVEDCSCACILLMLQATELGLGTCWGAVYHPTDKTREEYVRKILKLPEKYGVLNLIGIGYSGITPKEKVIKSFEDTTEVVE